MLHIIGIKHLVLSQKAELELEVLGQEVYWLNTLRKRMRIFRRGQMEHVSTLSWELASVWLPQEGLMLKLNQLVPLRGVWCCSLSIMGTPIWQRESLQRRAHLWVIVIALAPMRGVYLLARGIWLGHPKCPLELTLALLRSTFFLCQVHPSRHSFSRDLVCHNFWENLKERRVSWTNWNSHCCLFPIL